MVVLYSWLLLFDLSLANCETVFFSKCCTSITKPHFDLLQFPGGTPYRIKSCMFELMLHDN